MSDQEATTPQLHRFERVSLETLPLESARILGGDLYHRHRVRPLDHDVVPSFTVDAIVGRHLTIGLMQYSAGVHIETSHIDAYQVNIPLGAPLRTGSGDARTVASVESAAVYTRGKTSILQGWEDGGRVLAVKVDPVHLEERASMLQGRRVGDLDFALSLDLHNYQGREWLTLLRLLARPLVSADTLSQSPAIWDALEEGVIDSLLVLTGRGEAPGGAAPLVAQEGVLERALAYIEQHAEQPVGVPAIAAIAGVSVRTLQAVFREQMDTTPHEYLRRIRLQRARADLRATAGELSISDVARRWGFTNPGRFSAHYAQTFGELPKDTLRTRD